MPRKPAQPDAAPDDAAKQRQRKQRQFYTVSVQIPAEIKNILDGIERATGVGEIDQVRAALIRYAAECANVNALAQRVVGITSPAEIARVLATLPEYGAAEHA